MKVATDKQGNTLLSARPLLPEDQQEFKELEIMLDKDLRAIGLRQFDINGKAHKVYELISPKVNDRTRAILEDLQTFFKPTVPSGWKHESKNWVQQLSPVPAMSPVATPHPQLSTGR